jgi:AcrR family transcriptional regulator
MSTRDANKRDKHARIRSAASALFRTRGYAGTTTRAIAARAQVATGTLFLYVRDKDDALALVFDDDVAAMLADRRSTLPSRGNLASRLAHLCHGFYSLYAANPALAQRYVRTIPSREGPRRAAHEALNATIIAAFDAELARARDRGALRPRVDLAIARTNLFAVFRVCVYDWLARPPCDVAAGLTTLRAALAQLLRGVTRDD